MTERIRIVCQNCCKTDEEVKGWHPRCMKHGGPVCSGCCRKCEHRREFSGMYKCTYKTPEQRREEALKRSKDRMTAENIKITKAFMMERREAARKNAIKKAKARQREERQRRKTNEEVGRTQGAPEAREKE